MTIQTKRNERRERKQMLRLKAKLRTENKTRPMTSQLKLDEHGDIIEFNQEQFDKEVQQYYMAVRRKWGIGYDWELG